MAVQIQSTGTGGQRLSSASAALSIPQKMNLVCGFIQGYTVRTGFPPSIREIAAGCDLSLNTTFRYLRRLEAQDRVIRIPGQARSIRVVPVIPEHHAAETIPAPGGSHGQPQAWCDRRFCLLLSERLDVLCELILEKGASPYP